MLESPCMYMLSRSKKAGLYPIWQLIVVMSITPLRHSDAMRSRANWMSAVPERSLFELTLPGTHHSATSTISHSPFSTIICRRNAQCQSLSVLEQLQAGVRSLDVRVRLSEWSLPIECVACITNSIHSIPYILFR